MGTVRVATAQLRGDSFKNLNELIAYLESFLKSNPVDMLVLPEYTLLPLCQQSEGVTRAEVRGFYDEVFTALETDMKQLFQEIANTYNTHILVGSHWTVIDSLPYNAAYFFTPVKPVQVFPKCFPTPPEVAMKMEPGTAPGLVTLNNGVKAGILICYESEFPELARELALNGADILLVPSLTLNARGAARVEICAKARAVENQVYVVCSTNQAQLSIPVEKPICAVGQSGIYGPIDNKTRLTDGVVVRATADGDTILFAELDLTVLEESRQRSEAPLRKNMKRVMQFEKI